MTKGSVFKRVLLLMLALSVILALTGCGEKPEEAPQNDVPAADDSLVPPPDAFAPFEPTQAELHEGDPMLVADAFRYTYMYMDQDENGNNKTYEHIYAIPCITMDSPEIAALNEQIYTALYNAELIETVEHNNENRGTYAPYYFGIEYSWAINNDILSLVIQAPTEKETIEYYVYNISVSEERLLSNDEVIAAHGMTKDAYLEQAKLAFSNAFWEAFAPLQAQVAVEPEALLRYEECLQNTMRTENLEAATPYFDMDGRLCAFGGFCFPTEDGQINTSVSLDDITLCPEWAEHVSA